MSVGTRPSASLWGASDTMLYSNRQATTIQVCPSHRFVLWLGSGQNTCGDLMAEAVEHKASKNLKKSRWWPAVATSLAGAAVVAFRGCWHRKMSWPIGMQGYSYQVCLSCGVKRLFDEVTFTAYGPFRYELDQLVPREGSVQPKPRHAPEMRPPMF